MVNRNQLEKKLKRIRYSASGFTLIELLIVIVIIGILAGVLLTVIDPARQQRKARETVLRTTVEKGCLALHACGGTSTDARNCDSLNEIGVIDPAGTPTGAAYFITSAAVPADANVAAPAATSTMTFRGIVSSPSPTPTCRFQCNYNFNTSTAGQMSVVTATDCVIGIQ